VAAIETSVVVVGAGPVGLTLAADLGLRGVDVTVLEVRPAGQPPSVKCNHVSSRSMEAFRRLGVAERVREAGLPADHPIDATFGPSVVAPEQARIAIPSRADRARGVRSPDADWPTPEPPHRINQIYLEPILFDHVRSADEVTILNRTEFVAFEQDDDGVTVRAIDVESCEPLALTARYLIGCDGPASTVRKAIAAQLSGTPDLGSWLSTFIRAPDLTARLQRPAAWMALSWGGRRDGAAIAIDGAELWLVHAILEPGETHAGTDRDRAIRDVLGVDGDFRYDVLGTEDWVARRLVADRFRRGRAFIAGDAAHLWIPVAGYGMNAGIADATDLAWQLAGVLAGWGGPGLLDAYERERRPITEQVSRFAMDLGRQLDATRKVEPPDPADTSAAAEQARAEHAAAIVATNTPQFFCAGLNFGYFYDDSPVIAHDGATPPPYSMGEYQPSTVPGCRIPHVTLRDGQPLCDALGGEWALLRIGLAADPEPLLAAAAHRGMPMQLLDLTADEAAGLYDHALVLSRPDGHVAWRDDVAPADPLAVIDRVRGAL
jgi:2-polyprenyl-6-methoxyphenol hydroxylase-like FAD-dependent oxidoreductase